MGGTERVDNDGRMADRDGDTTSNVCGMEETVRESDYKTTAEIVQLSIPGAVFACPGCGKEIQTIHPQVVHELSRGTTIGGLQCQGCKKTVEVKLSRIVVAK